MSIFNLSWNEANFFAKLKLFVASIRRERKKMRSDNLCERTGGYSALSSTYYSIASSASAQFKAIFKLKCLILAPFRLSWWLCSWLPLGAWCYWRMLPLSNRVVFLRGYDAMSAEQCDIRQSILRKRGKWAEALFCINAGLKKNSNKLHTTALFHIGTAEIFKEYGDWRNAEIEMQVALALAPNIEKTDPRQAIRIYRHCANLTDWFEAGDPLPGATLRRKAEQLAREIGAKDQILKI